MLFEALRQVDVYSFPAHLIPGGSLLFYLPHVQLWMSERVLSDHSSTSHFSNTNTLPAMVLWFVESSAMTLISAWPGHQWVKHHYG